MKINEKLCSFDHSFGLSRKPEAVRAFYLSICCYSSPDLSLINTLDSNLYNDVYKFDLSRFETSFSACIYLINKIHDIFKTKTQLAGLLSHESLFDIARLLCHNLKTTIDVTLEPNLKEFLQQLDLPFPSLDITENPENIRNYPDFLEWWSTQGSDWSKEFLSARIIYSNIFQDLQFTDQDEESLKEYYEANKLLIECMNGFSSAEVRQKIQETLFLPSYKIYQRDNYSNVF
jgi:hypothetical protein